MVTIVNILVIIFLVAFFSNLFYELLHSMLYKTCREASWKKYIYLMLKAALFDGFAIAAMCLIATSIFKNPNYQLIAFLIMCLLFAYGWELYAIKNKRWEYSEKMPKILGVGVTPLAQLALTGFLSIYISLTFFI